MNISTELLAFIPHTAADAIVVYVSQFTHEGMLFFIGIQQLFQNLYHNNAQAKRKGIRFAC
ncbi:MAG: hypothetical protein HQM11_10345 [SAR324 cluster bacterium]|nr:hypothetical protein [SAR324 cluster bacterium]